MFSMFTLNLKDIDSANLATLLETLLLKPKLIKRFKWQLIINIIEGVTIHLYVTYNGRWLSV